MTTITQYQALRTTVGFHIPSAPLVRITGEDRLEFLDSFLSRSCDFVDPDTTRECLALTEDGLPLTIFLHIEREEESWLLPRTDIDNEALTSYFDGLDTDGDVSVEIAPQGWGAAAVEGPLSWQIAEQLLDFDVAGLVLHAVADVVIPGAPEGSEAWLARVGTTGEYGYLLVSNSPDIARTTLLGRAEEIGGQAVDADALARVQAEAGMPYYAMGVHHLDVAEADLAWLVDWQRIGEFHGSDNLTVPVRNQRRLTAVAVPAGHRPAVGETITAGGESVGVVVYVAPSTNPDEELLFALVDAPFWASTIPLTVGDQDGVTVTLPRVVAASSLNKLG
ncbi:aminomethyl transferase family protein [Cutibacterium sp. WCA-380-WT-3A]|uniref:Aminomethyl transferase family protein n=1 Tax=Cutibacterium porci TaxID=2605781 RepID=A0A7K0J3W7_9ACTN|nr:aminomethyltransferase family protein [Cutibacterium porci]MSS44617.1 aminomethyl transferase family protein [Cutibacterium porci]